MGSNFESPQTYITEYLCNLCSPSQHYSFIQPDNTPVSHTLFHVSELNEHLHDGGQSDLRKLEKAVAVRNSLLERFPGKFRRCWKMILRFSGSAKCYPCQGLGRFPARKCLLENRPRLRGMLLDFLLRDRHSLLEYS